MESSPLLPDPSSSLQSCSTLYLQGHFRDVPEALRVLTSLRRESILPSPSERADNILSKAKTYETFSPGFSSNWSLELFAPGNRAGWQICNCHTSGMLYRPLWSGSAVKVATVVFSLLISP